MRVLLTAAVGSHALPLRLFAVELLARGADVRLVVPPAAAEVAERVGVPITLSAAPEADDAWARFALASPEEASVIANREVFGRLSTTAMLPTVTTVCADWRPDLVLADPAEYAAAIAADAAGIPYAAVAIGAATAEAGSLALARPELELFAPGVADRLLAAPYLTRFPTALDPSPYARTLRYREPLPPAPPPEPGPPLVYVTFGTVAGAGPGAPYAAVLEALADLDVRVLLSTGRERDVGPVPANARVVPWVDQDAVLPGAAAVVCHGGSGTVLGALAHGVPLVVVPLFADQPANAARIAVLGAGIVIPRSGGAVDRAELDGPGVAAVRSATRAVLIDPAYRAAAQRVAASWAGTDDVGAVLDRLL